MKHTVLGSGNWEGNTNKAYKAYLRLGVGRGNQQHQARVGQPIMGFPDGVCWGRTRPNVGRWQQTYLWGKCSCQRRRQGQRARLHWQLRYRTHNLPGPCSCDGNSYTNLCLTRWACRVCQCKGLGSLWWGSWDWSRWGAPRSHTLTKEEGQPWENHSDHHLSLFPG